MKKSVIVLSSVALGLLTTVFYCGCGNSKTETIKDGVVTNDEEMKRIDEEYLKDLENYRAETIVVLKQNENAIAELRLKMKNNANSSDLLLAKDIEKLEEKNNELKDKLDNYEEDGKTNWEKFKAEFKNDMTELGKAFKGVVVNDVK